MKMRMRVHELTNINGEELVVGSHKDLFGRCGDSWGSGQKQTERRQMARGQVRGPGTSLKQVKDSLVE